MCKNNIPKLHTIQNYYNFERCLNLLSQLDYYVYDTDSYFGFGVYTDYCPHGRGGMDGLPYNKVMAYNGTESKTTVIRISNINCIYDLFIKPALINNSLFISYNRANRTGPPIDIFCGYVNNKETNSLTMILFNYIDIYIINKFFSNLFKLFYTESCEHTSLFNYGINLDYSVQIPRECFTICEYNYTEPGLYTYLDLFKIIYLDLNYLIKEPFLTNLLKINEIMDI